MRKFVSMLLGSILAFNIYAEHIIDAYGVGYENGEKIVKKYGKELTEIEKTFLVFFNDYMISGNEHQKEIKKLSLSKQHLLDRLKKNENLIYANASTVRYPTTGEIYTTLELIKKGDEKRLVHAGSLVRKKRFPKHHDLIQKMMDYDAMALSIIMKKELDPSVGVCPFYHCTYGFSHPKLKPYINIFKEGIQNESPLVEKTLNQDPNPERRAAAAFLVGCYTNPKTIMTTLLPHLNDKDSMVRNNVMRTIGFTMKKANISDIDVNPFIDMLDSAQLTDRNKALVVLLQAAESPKSRKIILKNSREKLLALLALKQPDNHEIAYLLLKKISNKNFGEHDMKAWQQWSMVA